MSCDSNDSSPSRGDKNGEDVDEAELETNSDEEMRPVECVDDTESAVDKPLTKVVDTSKKKKKAGVMYLSTVPQSMTVAQLRQFMSQFGEVGRIFLQPESEFE
jgi:ESF2/ABP1 family protein